jgi:Phage integrase, N-terminal SAM-like domain
MEAGKPTPEESPPTRLEDRVRETLRLRQMSYRTEEAYWGWIRQYILFHRKQHPDKLGPNDVRSFLSHLVRERRVAIATQRQALNVLVFLYEAVLGRGAALKEKLRPFQVSHVLR